jgi:predicted nucleic acid-binding protein
MPDVVLLDAGPLGMASHPRPATDILSWLARLLDAGVAVMVPEIADYEVRRELIRAGLNKSVARLDFLKSSLEYLPITTAAMLRAADFWADSRRRGRPRAHERPLDADAILAGQSATLTGKQVMVATANPRHINRFVPAVDWQEIAP